MSSLDMRQPNQGSKIKQQVNKFTFTDADNTIKIVFYPYAPGSLWRGEGRPRLEYQENEGSFLFIGDQIQKQDSASGSVISLVLRKSNEAKALALKLVLPPEDLTDQNQAVEAVLLKTRSFGIVPQEGVRLLYEVFLLQGRVEYSPALSYPVPPSKTDGQTSERYSK